MKQLIQPKLKQAKDDMIAKVKQDTLESSKETVRLKVKEQIEIEKSNFTRKSRIYWNLVLNLT